MKDRTALQIIDEAEAAGLLRRGDTIYEGKRFYCGSHIVRFCFASIHIDIAQHNATV